MYESVPATSARSSSAPCANNIPPAAPATTRNSDNSSRANYFPSIHQSRGKAFLRVLSTAPINTRSRSVPSPISIINSPPCLYPLVPSCLFFFPLRHRRQFPQLLRRRPAVDRLLRLIDALLEGIRQARGHQRRRRVQQRHVARRAELPFLEYITNHPRRVLQITRLHRIQRSRLDSYYIR